MRDEAQEHIVRMQTLKESEGWRLFEAVLDSTMASAIAGAMKEKEAFAVAKHLGILKAAQDLRSWPDREIMAAQDKLKGDAAQ